MSDTGYGALPPPTQPPPPPVQRRRHAWTVAVPIATTAVAATAVVAVVITIGINGDDDAPERAAAAQTSASAAGASIASASAAAEASASASQQAVHDACQRQLRGLDDTLGEINSRLSVGIDYQEYADRVGDARVEYDDVVAGVDGLTPTCLEAARPLEDALNRYATVLDVWGECIDSYYCDFATGQANRKAQRLWLQADKKLSRAQSLLSNMQP